MIHLMPCGRKFSLTLKSFVMKRIVLLFLLMLPMVVMGQKTNKQYIVVDSLFLKIDTLLMTNNELLNRLDINTSLKNRYKMYQTENIYTFLELDTKTGKVKQVQWSLESDNEGTWIINGNDLSFGEGYGSGSFELYPTKNLYQFLLIDKTDGRKWHIQWGMGDNKRWIRRIYW